MLLSLSISGCVVLGDNEANQTESENVKYVPEEELSNEISGSSSSNQSITITCTACDGTGVCWGCGGAGTYSHSSDGNEKYTCEACKGSGKCNACGGTGLAYTDQNG